MAGNVWQWCEDEYDSTYYAKSPSSNPIDSHGSVFHVLRGGSWDVDTANDFRSVNRFWDYAEPGSRDVGFRCVLNSQDSDFSFSQFRRKHRQDGSEHEYLLSANQLGAVFE